MNKELVLAIIEYVDAHHELATNPFSVYSHPVQCKRVGNASKRLLELMAEDEEEKKAVENICGEERE